MIFYILGTGIVLYGFFNFKKAFGLYVCYKLLLVTNITIISSPGLPLLTLEMAMTIVFVMLFFIHGKKYQFAHMKFPFAIPFGLYALSMVLSSLFSVAGFMTESTNLLKELLENVILVWMIWQVFETKEDFRFLVKNIAIIIFLSCIYGFIEYILQRNPLTEYEMSLNHDPDRLIDYSYSITERGYRINSFFEHAIGAGINWALFAVFGLIFFQREQGVTGRVAFIVLTAILCIPCIFLTKMRSPLLFFVIALFAIVNFKKRRFRIILYCGIISIGVCVPFLSDNILNLIFSFFNSQSADAVGGSSLSMRLDQLEAAFTLMLKAPVFGLGPSFMDVMSGDLVDRLLGSESVWFSVITQLGVVGIFVYLVQIYYFVIKLPRKFKSKELFFISLAYWITYTISSLPGFCNVLFYVIFFYFIKSSPVYQRAVAENKVYGIYFKGASLRYNVIKKGE